MTLLNFRTFMSMLMCFLMIQPYAMANVHTQISVDEKIRILKKANPKTIGEFWKAVKPTMRADIHAKYAKFLKPYENVRLPKMKFKKNRIEILNRGRVTTVWLNHVQDGSLKVNNKLIWHDYVGDPKVMTEAMRDAVSKRKVSLMEMLFLQEAHAFSWLTLLLGAVGGWLLSAWYSPSEAYSDVKGMF